MSARYYQGTSVHGPVKASASQTFQDVVDSFRICPTLGISHAAFLALDRDKRDELKQVPFYVPATFKASPSKRVYDQAETCNLIFLDIDPEKEKREGKWVETGRYPAAPLYHDPNQMYASLAGLNFAAYVTASHTHEKPRMRVVVDADNIPLSDYPRAVATIGAMLGLSSVTTESKVGVQPMFLPTQFLDSAEEDHPLIAHRTDARPFTVRDISDVADTTPHPNGSNGSNGKNGHSLNGANGHHPTGSVDDLEYLRAPVPEITLKIAKDALSAVDADCSYHEWLEMAAALRHQFSPHKEEEAFQIFDEWSQTGRKYVDEKETRSKWGSFKPSAKGRFSVTIRSLLKRATESGWDDKKVKEDIFALLLRWTEEVPTMMELLDGGPKKILASPMMTSMQENAVVSHLCLQLKKRFSYSISPTAVRKDLDRLRKHINANAEPEEKKKEPKWTQGLLYISAAQDFFRRHTGEKYKTQDFNSIYSRHLLPSKEMLLAAGTPINEATLSKPTMLPADYALNTVKVTTVYDYAYDPSQPTETFFVDRRRKYVNVYRPTHPELDPARAAEAGAMLQMHLSNLIAEPEYRLILMDFMATMVQFPGRKIRWGVLLQSGEGAGKTFLAEMMSVVLGKEHVKVIDGTAIKSGWNEWAFGHQLVVIEEVRVAGTNKHEVMNALKPLITNDVVSLNERFRNNRQAQNISNYMLFSNHHNALALTSSDRRYFVVKSPLQSKAQVVALGDNYFSPLYNMLRDHPGAMRSYLMDWEISPEFRPDGHAPRTKYVDEMVHDSANDLTATVRRLLLEADVPLVQYDIVSAKALTDVMQVEGIQAIPSAQQLAAVLREEGYSQIGRHMFGTDRHYIWVRTGVDPATAPATAADRFKRNLKNLCMELVY